MSRRQDSLDRVRGGHANLLAAILGYMASTYPPLPPRDHLLALIQAGLSNAADLLADAQLLADAGRFPRAVTLAMLAWEEVSKGELCALALVLPEFTPEYFWEHFRDHVGKLSRVHAFAAFMQAEPIGAVDDYVKKVMDQSKSAQKLKERSLYVDYRRGKILLPSQIGERAARKQIKAIREALVFAETSFSVDHLDAMFVQVKVLSAGLKNAMIADPDAVAAATQRALRDGSQEALQALVLRYATIPDDAPI